jgi:hypothetical protein
MRMKKIYSREILGKQKSTLGPVELSRSLSNHVSCENNIITSRLGLFLDKELQVSGNHVVERGELRRLYKINNSKNIIAIST